MFCLCFGVVCFGVFGVFGVLVIFGVCLVDICVVWCWWFVFVVFCVLVFFWRLSGGYLLFGVGVLCFVCFGVGVCAVNRTVAGRARPLSIVCY